MHCCSMASIQKRTKAGAFYAFYRDEHGRRACRCTELHDRGKAMSLALSWERAAAEAREGLLTVDKARKVLNEMLSLTGQAIDKETARDFADRWMAGKKKLKAARTAERYAPHRKAIPHGHRPESRAAPLQYLAR